MLTGLGGQDDEQDRRGGECDVGEMMRTYITTIAAGQAASW